MKSTKWFILFIIFVSINIFGQQTTFQDSLLERMIGNWTLKGIIDSKETTHDVAISWILGHQYLQISEISHELNSYAKPAYEALVLIGWDLKLNQYSCLWLDVTSGGGLSAQPFAHAERKADKIAFLFKVNDGSAFHTSFVYDRKSDSWQWLMDGEEKGKMQPFARVKLVKK